MVQLTDDDDVIGGIGECRGVGEGSKDGPSGSRCGYRLQGVTRDSRGCQHCHFFVYKVHCSLCRKCRLLGIGSFTQKVFRGDKRSPDDSAKATAGTAKIYLLETDGEGENRRDVGDVTPSCWYF